MKVENKSIIIGCTIILSYIKEVAEYLLVDCKNTSVSYNPEFVAQRNNKRI